MKISLNKYIASCGIASRRHADELIANGKIFVNHKLSGNEKYIDPEIDVVTLDGEILKPEETKHYIMFNKPLNVLSSVKDNRGRKTVLAFVNVKERVYPVGRLDYNSTGLIILTNDGEFANHLTHPKYHLPKEYLVTLDENITDEQLGKLREGVYLDNERTLPAEVKRLDRNKFDIVLYQGKNRQIRRMCETLGLNVKKLHRIRIGNLKLEGLPKGKWKAFDKSILLSVNSQ